MYLYHKVGNTRKKGKYLEEGCLASHMLYCQNLNVGLSLNCIIMMVNIENFTVKYITHAYYFTIF